MGYWKERSLGNPRKEAAIAYKEKHRYCWFFVRHEPGELIEDRGYGAYFRFYDSAAFIPKWRKEVKEGRMVPISETEYNDYLEKRKKRPLLPPPKTKEKIQTARIYTDGACKNNPGPGGYAAIIQTVEGQIKVSGGQRQTTSIRMEITAAIAGLQHLEKPHKVNIFSDSRLLVKIINGECDSRANLDLIERLKAECEKHEVKATWVKGHAGVKLNEECDRLAKEESDRASGPSPEIKSKLAAKLAEIKAKTAKKHQLANQQEVTRKPVSTHSPDDLPNSEYAAKIKQIVLGLDLESDRPEDRRRSRKRKAPVLATVTIADDFPKVDRQELAATIDLLYSLGLPVLPVAPAFPAEDYPKRKYGKIIRDEYGNPVPKFNGKCPSYLDKSGRPHAISHKKFRWGRLPSIKEISKWFCHPCTGVGTLGNGNISFIDWDAKNFESLEASDKAAGEMLEKYGTNGLIEKTRSGGYRLAIRPTKQLPGKFSLAGKFCGEILGLNKFVVLAPTQGYTNLLRSREIPILDPSDLGLDDRSSLTKEKREERRSISRETDPFERFPALFWQKYKHSVKPWLFARYKDPMGSGRGKFTVEEAAEFFNRRPSTIETWLSEARKNGLCRNLDFRNGYYYFYYASVHKAAVSAGLENLGPCGLIDFEAPEERQNLAIAATEIIQSDRQRSSRWAAQQESPEEKLPSPAEFLQSCEKHMARELWRSERARGFSEGAKLYGSSLSNVATAADLSRRQVQRHLSKKYRQGSAPIKKYRGKEGLVGLDKAQLHQRLQYKCNAGFIRAAQEVGDADKYWVDFEGRVWERKCLIIAPRHQLVRWRFRRSRAGRSGQPRMAT